MRASTGTRYALLNPILEELIREGRIRITAGKDGDLVPANGIMNVTNANLSKLFYVKPLVSLTDR